MNKRSKSCEKSYFKPKSFYKLHLLKQRDMIPKHILLRKDINGIWVILPARTFIGIRVNKDNVDAILHDIYIVEKNPIQGYKTLAGAKRKILSLI